MYPTIYHVFYDWFGWEIPALKILNSFGFFVAMAFIAASYTLTRELERKDKFFEIEKRKVIIGKGVQWGEVSISAFIGFIMGWKVIWLMMESGTLFSPGETPQQHIFSMAGYPLLGLTLAAILGGLKYREYKKNELPEPQEKVIDFHKYEYTGQITLVAAIGGIAGAKFFHLFENPDEFMQFFKEPTLNNFLSGLTIYGGLICGGLIVWLYTRKKKIKTFHMMDAAAPGLILAYGVGRIGCQISGDGDWGIANVNPKPEWLSWLPDWLWAYEYPNNVNGVFGPQFGTFQGGYRGLKISEADPWPIFEGYGTYLDPGVYPTPVYETTLALIIFGVLWYLRKRINIPGMIFALYLMANGIERFFIEKIRVNNKSEFFRETLGIEITQAEIISTCFFLAGAIFAFWLWRNKDKLDRYPRLV